MTTFVWPNAGFDGDRGGRRELLPADYSRARILHTPNFSRIFRIEQRV